MNKLIEITSNTEHLLVGQYDNIGGIRYDISCTYQTADAINWIIKNKIELENMFNFVKEHKAQLEKEERLRAETPMLNDLWNQYQMVLKMVQ